MQRMGSLLDAQKRACSFEVLERRCNQPCSLGTLLYGSGWGKRTDTEDKAGHPCIQSTCEQTSSHQTTGSGADADLRPPSEKE